MNMKPTVEVTETNFETEVLKSNQPVLVGFATGWSLPSMTLDGILEEIASESVDSLKVARVKLDRSPISACGTAFDAFRLCCASSMAKNASEFLGRRAKKQFFLS